MLLSPKRILILSLCLALRWFGSAEASGFNYQEMPDPASGLVPIEVQAGSDALPDGWRFFAPDPNGNLPTGRGNTSVTIDPVTGRILESYREGDVEVREPLVLTPEQYNEILTGRTFHKLWQDKSKTKRSVARTTPGVGGPGFRFVAPVEMPGIVQKIVGKGAPAIEISGSETITLPEISIEDISVSAAGTLFASSTTPFLSK